MPSAPPLPLIILGAGGHARVLLDALLDAGAPLIGLTDAHPDAVGGGIRGVPVLGDDRILERHPPASVRLVNGLGSVGVSPLRRRLFEEFRQRGYDFPPVIHRSAHLAGDVGLGEGVQIMAGVVLQPGCRIGANAIINTRAAIDHDNVIAGHVHVSPGAVLCGGVAVGEGSHIGAGATLIQGIRIGRSCTVAAGAVVIRDVPDGATVAGIPARIIRT